MDTNAIATIVAEQIEEVAELCIEQLEMVAGGECVVNNI